MSTPIVLPHSQIPQLTLWVAHSNLLHPLLRLPNLPRIPPLSHDLRLFHPLNLRGLPHRGILISLADDLIVELLVLVKQLQIAAGSNGYFVVAVAGAWNLLSISEESATVRTKATQVRVLLAD